MKLLLRLIVVALLTAPAMADPTADAAKAVELGQVAEAEQRWEDAANHYAEAARLENSFENFDRALGAYFTAGDPASAAPYAEALVDYARSIDDQNMLAFKLFDYTNVLLELTDYDKAEPLLREGLPLARGTDLYWSFNNSLGALLYNTGRFKEALPRMQATVVNARATLDKNDPTLATYLRNLGSTLIKVGKYEDAEDALSESLSITKKNLGRDHSSYAIRLGQLAVAQTFQGKHRRAEKNLLEVRAALAPQKESLPREYGVHTYQLAQVTENRKKYDEAEQYYLEAIQVIENALGSQHAEATNMRNGYDRFRANRPPQ